MSSGILIYAASDLEKRLAKGEKMEIHIIGMLNLGNDITPELARADNQIDQSTGNLQRLGRRKTGHR